MKILFEKLPDDISQIKQIIIPHLDLQNISLEGLNLEQLENLKTQLFINLNSDTQRSIDEVHALDNGHNDTQLLGQFAFSSFQIRLSQHNELVDRINNRIQELRAENKGDSQSEG